MGSDLGIDSVWPTASFGEFEITTSSGESLEGIDQPHAVSLVYKLLNSSVWQIDLLIGFESNLGRRRKKLPNRAATPLTKSLDGNFFLVLVQKMILMLLNIKKTQHMP